MIVERGARGRCARGGTGLNTAGVPFPAGRAPVHSLPFRPLPPTRVSFRDRLVARVRGSFTVYRTKLWIAEPNICLPNQIRTTNVVQIFA